MFSSNKLTNFVIWVAMIGVICFIAGGSIMTSEYRKYNGTQKHVSGEVSDEKSAGTIDGISEITIDTESIPVNVISYDGNEVKAQLKGSVNDSNPPVLSVSNSSGKIQIRADSKGSFIIFGSMNVNLDVYIPSKYAKDLKAASSSGGVELSDFNLSEVECSSHSGSLKIKNLTANEISLKSDSGSISAENLKGSVNTSSLSGSTKLSNVNASDIDVSSASGSVVLDEVSGAIKAEAVSGSIRANINKLTGDIYLKNTSGSCRLNLPSGSQFYLKANSTSGSIHCGFPVSGNTDSHYIDGSVNNGSIKITLKTVSGSISIN